MQRARVVIIYMTSVVANLPEGPPIKNSLGPRKWKFTSAYSSSMYLNFYHKCRSPTWGIAYVKGEEIFECYHFGQNGSGVLCLWRITDQVCLGQNGFFWHPRVLWKFLEAWLRLWACRACTGCYSGGLVKHHLEPKWCSR